MIFNVDEVMMIVEDDYPNGINWIELYHLCEDDADKTLEVLKRLIEKFKP